MRRKINKGKLDSSNGGNGNNQNSNNKDTLSINSANGKKNDIHHKKNKRPSV